MRFAAQYIYASGKLYPLHLVEIDEPNDSPNYRLYPLDKEYADTTFYDGLITVFPEKNTIRLFLFENMDVTNMKILPETDITQLL